MRFATLALLTLLGCGASTSPVAVAPTAAPDPEPAVEPVEADVWTGAELDEACREGTFPASPDPEGPLVVAVVADASLATPEEIAPLLAAVAEHLVTHGLADRAVLPDALRSAECVRPVPLALRVAGEGEVGGVARVRTTCRPTCTLSVDIAAPGRPASLVAAAPAGDALEVPWVEAVAALDRSPIPMGSLVADAWSPRIGARVGPPPPEAHGLTEREATAFASRADGVLDDCVDSGPASVDELGVLVRFDAAGAVTATHWPDGTRVPPAQRTCADAALRSLSIAAGDGDRRIFLDADLEVRGPLVRSDGAGWGADMLGDDPHVRLALAGCGFTVDAALSYAISIAADGTVVDADVRSARGVRNERTECVLAALRESAWPCEGARTVRDIACIRPVR